MFLLLFFPILVSAATECIGGGKALNNCLCHSGSTGLVRVKGIGTTHWLRDPQKPFYFASVCPFPFTLFSLSCLLWVFLAK